MKKSEISKSMCSLATLVRTRVYKDDIPADCFCDSKVKASRFQFDPEVYAFIHNAVLSAIEAHEKHTQNEENGAACALAIERSQS